MVQFKVVKGGCAYGTSLIGEYCASYTALRAVLGAPNSPRGGDGKTSTEWIVRDNFGGVYTIYDYKETNLYSPDLPSVRKFRQRPVYDWHIGGGRNTRLSELVEWLSAKIRDWTNKESQAIQDAQNKAYEAKYAAAGVPLMPLETPEVPKVEVPSTLCTSATARCLG